MLNSKLRNPESSKMYPSSVKQGFGDLVVWISNIGGAPIEWEKNQLRVKTKQKFKWYLSTFLLSLYFAFLVLRIVLCVVEQRKLQEYNLLLFVFLAYLSTFIFYLELIFRGFDLILVVNSTIKYFDFFHGESIYINKYKT